MRNERSWRGPISDGLVGHPLHLRFRTGWEKVKKPRKLQASRLTFPLECPVGSCYLLLFNGVLTLEMTVMALVIVCFSTACLQTTPLTMDSDISPDVPTTSTRPRPRHWHGGSGSGGYTFVVLIRFMVLCVIGEDNQLKGLVR